MSKAKCKNCKRHTNEIKVCDFCHFHSCKYCNPKNKCRNCGHNILKVIKYRG